MTFEEYQTTSRTTAIYPADQGLVYVGLGLASEAGEVAGKIKKVIRDGNGELTPERNAAIAAELGDVLWYVAQLATELGVSLDEMAQQNLDKLLSRKQRNQLGGDGDNR